jgi:hypothetical protein
LDAVDRPRQRSGRLHGRQRSCEFGLIYCETNVETADVKNFIEDLLDGNTPTRSGRFVQRRNG